MTRRHTRRELLGAGALTTVGALAGCTGNGDDGGDGAESTATPAPGEEPTAPDIPMVENPPDAVYIPTHRESMRHLPTVEAGEYALSPMVTYPHRFWLVTGTEREEVVPADGRGVHLMITLWDSETGQVLPVDAGAGMRVLKDGDVIDQRAPWPMISQTMGFHFGDNVALPEDGTYTVEVELTPINTRKTGDFEGRFEESVTASFEFEYDEAFRQETIGGIEYLDEEFWGQRGALEPPNHAHDDGHGESDHDDADHDDGHNDDHDHRMPFSSLSPAEEYPGRDLGEHESGDARFVVRHLEETRFTDDDSGYLLVSPRTPYNRVPLADMALSVDGAVSGDLEQILDSEVGLHYGIATDLSAGDTFDLVVDSPPQVSRHAGYETAFLDMSAMRVEVPE